MKSKISVVECAEEFQKDGRLWLNPGSCGPRRFLQPITMALMEVEESGAYRIKRIDLSPQRMDVEGIIKKPFP